MVIFVEFDDILLAEFDSMGDVDICDISKTVVMATEILITKEPETSMWAVT